jgi:hypothetical protein
MISKLVWIYENNDKKKKVEENAYNWVIGNLIWEKNIVPHFHEVFTAAKQVKVKRLQQNSAVSKQQVESLDLDNVIYGNIGID